VRHLWRRRGCCRTGKGSSQALVRLNHTPSRQGQQTRINQPTRLFSCEHSTRVSRSIEASVRLISVAEAQSHSRSLLQSDSCVISGWAYASAWTGVITPVRLLGGAPGKMRRLSQRRVSACCAVWASRHRTRRQWSGVLWASEIAWLIHIVGSHRPTRWSEAGCVRDRLESRRSLLCVMVSPAAGSFDSSPIPSIQCRTIILHGTAEQTRRNRQIAEILRGGDRLRSGAPLVIAGVGPTRLCRLILLRCAIWRPISSYSLVCFVASQTASTPTVFPHGVSLSSQGMTLDARSCEDEMVMACALVPVLFRGCVKAFDIRRVLTAAGPFPIP